MKRTLSLIALVAIFSAMMVSCKNKQSEPTPEEIQAQKVALADSVLAEIDAIYAEYMNAYENGFQIANLELTESEKLIKPDYLLEPSKVNEFVTKSQKVNALAIYFVERAVRKIYDMPLEETTKAIVQLLADYNYPIENLNDKPLPSDKIKTLYEACRESGDLAAFWQFQNAIIVETSYLIAQNTELFFSKITDEQWKSYLKRLRSTTKAVEKLAMFDPEMVVLRDFKQQFSIKPSEEERDAVYSSCKAAKSFVKANNDKYMARRNALLQ